MMKSFVRRVQGATRAECRVGLEASLDGFRFLSHSINNKKMQETDTASLPNPSPGKL